MKRDEGARQPGRGRAAAVIHDRLRDAEHAPAAEPDAPGKVRAFEGGEEVRIESPDLAQDRGADDHGRAFRAEDLERRFWRRVGLAIAKVIEEAGAQEIA